MEFEKKNEATALYPLTHPQNRIWYTENINPDKPLYNIGGPVRIKGNIELKFLEKAINTVISEHSAFQIRLIEQNGTIYQSFNMNNPGTLDYIDFSVSPKSEKLFFEWIDKNAKIPFQLLNSPLFYFALFKIGPNDMGYFVKLHHIISDGWSITILTNEISKNYLNLITENEKQPINTSVYQDFVELESVYLKSSRAIKDQKYWNDYLSDFPPELLTKRAAQTKGKRKSFIFNQLLSRKINHFAKQNSISINILFIYLTLLYSAKVQYHKDMIIGIPVLNRTSKEEKSIFGMFTSTMPFRYSLPDYNKSIDTLHALTKEFKKCLIHQKYPFDLMVKDLPFKDSEHNQLFDVCVNYYNTKLNMLFNGFPVENLEFYNGHQAYSLQIIIRQWSENGDLFLDFDYLSGKYTSLEIDQMFAAFTSLIHQVTDKPLKRNCDFHLIDEIEWQRKIVDFNQSQLETPLPETVISLFEQNVGRHPHKQAVSSGNISLTYQELDGKANAVCQQLLEKGIKPQSVIALITTLSIESVIAILGILKANCAYLPIDKETPVERLRFMLDDAEVEIILTNIDLNIKYNFSTQIINISEAAETQTAADFSPIPISPEHLAYVIYTSGSTGRPKGVQIEHKGLLNYIWWAKHQYVLTENEVFPLYSSLAFDLTVTSIFTPLISGGEIIAYPDDEDEYSLYRIINENKVTVIKLTPSHLSLLKNRDLSHSNINTLIVGGEDFKSHLAAEITEGFQDDIRIFNEYGPTETVVGCMTHQYNKQKDLDISVPIGVPAGNVQIYLLDRHLQPVPVHLSGELYISGDSMARGYLHNDSLTAAKFIDNPFIPGKKMYKSGDLAKHLPNGSILYLGRIDKQLKINGFRIETGEIEKYLLSLTLIKEVYVTAASNKTQNRILLAYIVTNETISDEKITANLGHYLPAYMIPRIFIRMDHLPLTVNGKIDETKLPLPQFDLKNTRENEKGSDNNTDNHLFTNSQKTLQRIIGTILNYDEISLADNFFHLGGDSIKAIQIASRLRGEGLTIKTGEILSHPVLAEMSQYLTEQSDEVISQTPCSGTIINTAVANWFFNQNFNNPNHYHQSVLLDLKIKINSSLLNKVMIDLIQHHDALRINVQERDGTLFYNQTYLEHQHKIEVYDLSSLTAEKQYEKITESGQKVKSEFNIHHSLLFKIILFELGTNGQKLLFICHHLVIDGVSWTILLDDISTLIRADFDKTEAKLTMKTHSFQEWSSSLRNNRELFLKEKSYWQTIIDFSCAHPVFPLENKMADVFTQNRKNENLYHKENLSTEITADLEKRCHKSYGTSNIDLITAALGQTCAILYGLKEAVILLEGHGRETITQDLDLSRTVGWFTSIFPVKLKDLQESTGTILKSTKEILKNIPMNGMGFGILKYCMDELHYPQSKKWVCLNYLGNFDTSFKSDLFSLNMNDSGGDRSVGNVSEMLLEINSYIYQNKLHFTLTSSDLTYSELTNFSSKYKETLTALINHCSTQAQIDYTPSDFETIDLSQDELDGLLL